MYDKTNNRFIVFGGLTSGNEVEVCVNDTYQLVIENDALFTLNEAVSPGRLGYDCRKIGRSNSGYGEGSSQGGSSSSSGPMAVWKKLHCTGTLPSPRWCHSGVLHGEDMIVFGGWSYERTVGVGTGSKFFNDVHMLNITTLVWTKVETTGSPPRARCQCACFLFQNKIDDLADKGSEEEKDDINYKTNTESRHLSDSDLKRHTKGTSGEMEYSSSSLSAHSKEGKSASTPLSIEIGSIAAKLTSNTSSPLELILNPAEEFKKKNVKCVKVSGTLLDGSFDSKDGDIDINQLSLSHYTSAMATNSDSDSHIRGAKVFSSEKMSSATCDRGSESSLLGTLDLVLSGSARETNEEIGSLDGGHEVIGKTDTQGEGQQEQEEQENSSMRVHCGNESVAISPATGKSYRSEGEGSGTVDRVMESGSDEPPGRGVIRVPPVESNQDSSISSNSNSNSNSISSSSKTSEVEMVMETETEAETETETEQPVASKGYMIIFGGSCHNQEVESPALCYGCSADVLHWNRGESILCKKDSNLSDQFLFLLFHI